MEDVHEIYIVLLFCKYVVIESLIVGISNSKDHDIPNYRNKSVKKIGIQIYKQIEIYKIYHLKKSYKTIKVKAITCNFSLKFINFTILNDFACTRRQPRFTPPSPGRVKHRSHYAVAARCL